MGMIGIQPDLGSVLVLVSITACMILVSGIRWRIIGSVFLAAIAGIGLTIAAWAFLPSKISTFLEDSVFKHVTGDRKSTRLNSSHVAISYAVFCLKKKKHKHQHYMY